MHVNDVLPRDAIPSIDDPAFAREYAGAPDDEVVVVESDPPRAYPLRTLSYHEIVNDVVDGRPVAVTWCPICWSAVVYDRTVDGRALTFGVSGKLADDALVMYDRETGSEWKQTSGACIAGEFEGRDLTVIPAPLTTWEAFAADNPDGVVLQPVRPSGEYEMAPYERYAEREVFGLRGMRGQGPERSWDRTDVGAKTVVVGVERGDEAVGYPVPRVRDAGGAVTDTVGGRPGVVFATDGATAVYESPGFEFAPAGDGRFRADGATWDPATGRSDDGRALERAPFRRLFAFAWQDDHGPDAFWGLDGT